MCDYSSNVQQQVAPALRRMKVMDSGSRIELGRVHVSPRVSPALYLVCVKPFFIEVASARGALRKNA